MSCCICINQKEVLKCSVGLIEDLYYEILETIELQHLKISSEFDEFIKAMYVEIITLGGGGVDIAQLLRNAEDLKLLVNLLKIIIPKIKASLRPYSAKALQNFYIEIVNYSHLQNHCSNVLARG